MAMHAALLRSGMPLVHVPAAVHGLLKSAARGAGLSLQVADPRTVRRWLLEADGRQSELSREEGAGLLLHCLSDLGSTATASDLRGLQLVPLLDGSLGWIDLTNPEMILGEPVILRGLASKPELNGRRGVVIEFDASNR